MSDTKDEPTGVGIGAIGSALLGPNFSTLWAAQKLIRQHISSFLKAANAGHQNKEVASEQPQVAAGPEPSTSAWARDYLSKTMGFEAKLESSSDGKWDDSSEYRSFRRSAVDIDFDESSGNEYSSLEERYRGLYIDEKTTEEIRSTSIESRLKAIDDFVLSNPGVIVSPLIASFFPEIVAHHAKDELVALPAVAPAFWATDKLSGDTPPEFIQRHYAPWLDGRLARPDIKRLDPQLYVALSNWLRSNSLPEGFSLPTLKERNDQLVSDAKAGNRPVYGEMTARELGRLSGAIHRRKGRNE